MADYVNPEDMISHYPNDGHPQCEQNNLLGAPMTREDYEKALQTISDMRYPDKVFLEGIDYRDPAQVAAADFLRMLGVDLSKEHHRETPRRLAEAMKEMTTREHFKFTTFAALSQNMITLGPIPFYTMCAHHTLPFHGNVWIGYVPDERIAGLSKFARAVEFVAKGFHVQEELTTEIHSFLSTVLDPKGMAVVMKAEHMCMAMRGAKVPGVITTTSEMSGVFADHGRTAKAEFMEWIRA